LSPSENKIDFDFGRVFFFFFLSLVGSANFLFCYIFKLTP
jgi:hypothetical protein